MRQFPTVAMIDWSGVEDRGAAPKADAIWAAVVRDGAAEPPIYLRSIATAEMWIAGLIEAETTAARPLLLGADFPFAYPAGLAERITGDRTPQALWAWFADAFGALEPGEGRFDIAARLNRLFEGEGPFWFNGLARDIPHLPPKKPTALPAGLPERRAVERLEQASFASWQMGGAGAVGSQAMTGMALIGRLKRRFGDQLSIWPFEDEAPAQLVEIWPSLLSAAVATRVAEDPGLPRDPEGRVIEDAAQVMVLAEAVAAADARSDLADLLAEGPPEARAVEGWILGAGAAGRARLVPDTAHRGRLEPPPPLKNDCFALPPGVDWTPVDEALGMLRARLRPVTGIEEVAVGDADGRVLAEAVTARRSNPPGANSAVDGYGFAHGATGEGPQILPLLAGRAAAGAPYGDGVPPGTAIRILTGALLPQGVDTVILEEDTRSDGARVAFNGPVRKGANTRRAGEDVEAGNSVLAPGQALRPPDIALLTAVGTARVEVRARLRVGVLSTGDELAAPDATADPGRTYDANRPMLLALARRWRHEGVDLGHVGDDRAALRDRLDTAEVDVILTSGGASAGDEDHVSALLGEAGALSAWRIALKPGRPLALGIWQGRPVFGLPGNPVAAFTCALIFARPALSVLAGGHWQEPVAMTLPAAFSKRKKPGRREYLRARIGPEGVEAFASEGSGRISGIAWAEGLVELGDEAMEIRPGDPVRFLPYAGFGLG